MVGAVGAAISWVTASQAKVEHSGLGAATDLYPPQPTFGVIRNCGGGFGSPPRTGLDPLSKHTAYHVAPAPPPECQRHLSRRSASLRSTVLRNTVLRNTILRGRGERLDQLIDPTHHRAPLSTL